MLMLVLNTPSLGAHDLAQALAGFDNLWRLFKKGLNFI
jgi:hypothetical protein